MLLRAIYESNVNPFVLIHTIPDGFGSALLLSHDIDARESFRNWVAFATLEQRYGTSSTFFVTTKYFDDATDSGYYTPRAGCSPAFLPLCRLAVNQPDRGIDSLPERYEIDAAFDFPGMIFQIHGTRDFGASSGSSGILTLRRSFSPP
jgi:hypothetical protein